MPNLNLYSYKTVKKNDYYLDNLLDVANPVAVGALFAAGTMFLSGRCCSIQQLPFKAALANGALVGLTGAAANGLASTKWAKPKQDKKQEATFGLHHWTATIMAVSVATMLFLTQADCVRNVQYIGGALQYVPKIDSSKLAATFGAVTIASQVGCRFFLAGEPKKTS